VPDEIKVSVTGISANVLHQNHVTNKMGGGPLPTAHTSEYSGGATLRGQVDAAAHVAVVGNDV
jgi:hypothetical protein